MSDSKRDSSSIQTRAKKADIRGVVTSTFHRSLFVASVVLTAGVLALFQNCTQKKILVEDDASFGGGSTGGIDGKLVFNSFGDCGGSIGVKRSIYVSYDYSQIWLVRSSCRDNAQPILVSNSKMQFLKDLGIAVDLANEEILDLQTNPSSQRITTDVCAGTSSATSIQIGAVWLTSANAFYNFGKVLEIITGVNTGVLAATKDATNEKIYTSLGGQAGAMTLDLATPSLSYSINGGPEQTSVIYKCYVQPLPENLSSAPPESKYSWRQAGWGACSRPCGGGVRAQLVLCGDNEAQEVVDPSNCSQETRPDDSQPCNLQACEP